MLRVKSSLVRMAGLCLLLVGLGMPMPVVAAEPDYALPARLVLPWPCSEGHRVTWDPEGHWTDHKATGIAFDFSMREGTPLYAPADGVAYFLQDERPLKTNFGNYIELAVEGGWLIRMAHLRDPQSGERAVRVGDLLGYSGSSGVPYEHLHLELLVRNGTQWVRPELTRLDRFFGLPLADFVQGTVIVNDGCPPRLALASPVGTIQEGVTLGDTVELLVLLRNDGLESLLLDAVQVSLSSPTGAPLVAETRGSWSVDGKGAAEVVVRARPDVAGTWHVRAVTCLTNGATRELPAEGVFTVAPSALRLVRISAPPTLEVGDRIVLEAEVENTGGEDLVLDDLLVEGVLPDGTPWRASANQESTIPASSVARFTLRSSTVPHKVGSWSISRLSYEREGQAFSIAKTDLVFQVLGPELVIDQVSVYPSGNRLEAFLTITNIGTHTALPDAIEVWGWRPDGEEHFSMIQDKVAPLAPGASALIRLGVDLDATPGEWQLVEAGSWVGGTYYRLELPHQPAITLDISDPDLRP